MRIRYFPPFRIWVHSHFSAVPIGSTLERMLEVEPKGYIRKPFQEKNLLAVVRKAIDGGGLLIQKVLILLFPSIFTPGRESRKNI